MMKTFPDLELKLVPYLIKNKPYNRKCRNAIKSQHESTRFIMKHKQIIL